MSRPGTCLAFVMSSAVLLSNLSAQATGLTFDQRIEAQHAIDRVYHSHQIGVAQPFEQAMPQAQLERKIRDYLAQSAALRDIWHSPVTTESLQREMSRIAFGTKLPDRLLEIYAALDNDAYLIQETLVRPALVDRLSRNFFAFDERIHGAARREAEAIRDSLIQGRTRSGDESRRTVVDLVLRDPDRSTRGSGSGATEIPGAIELDTEEFENARARNPGQPGGVSPVIEETDRFVVEMTIASNPGHLQIARYTVPKVSWETWWEKAQTSLSTDKPLETADPKAALALPAPEASLSCMPDDTWQAVAVGQNMLPARRTRHSAIWTGTLMIVWGGEGPSNLNSGGRYDPLLDLWQPTSTIGAPTARAGHEAVWTGTRMIVWSNGTGGRYDPANDTWTSVSTVGAPPAPSGPAVWTGSEMIVWNGTGGGRYDPVADAWTPMSTTGAPASTGLQVWTGSEVIVWNSGTRAGGRYNPTTDQWMSMSSVNSATARGRATVVWTGNQMIVWGGTNYGTSTPINTGARYRPATDTWTPMTTTNAPSARYGHAAVWSGTRMIVWGGGRYIEDGADSDGSGALYDPVNDSWLATPLTNAPEGRLQVTAVWAGNRMIVWGGDNGIGVAGQFFLYNTGGRFDPSANLWTPTTGANFPSNRIGHTTVWTGSAMIVWGGDATFSSPPTGVRYDPALDNWRPISSVSAPQTTGTAVWTGTLMIIWGGILHSGGRLNTGGRYDPLADTWSPTTTLGAPTGRSGHSAVWTGSEMIVWGGYIAGYVNTGGRYDPLADTWSPTTTVGAPAARDGHTAVWTGSRMVVWGASVADNSGGLYEPSTDSWQPTSLTGAPEARSIHTAVLSGARMIIWGGYSPVSGLDLDTGANYDPVSDLWSTTSPIGAPAPRELHTAIWTGNEMIIWGGYDGGTSNTGARYAPAADAWSATSTVGAPSGRYYHTAVWTGGRMIVWGGYDGTSSNTGAHYAIGQMSDDDLDGLTECTGDCDDTNASVWVAPSEPLDLVLSHDGTTTLTWDPPSNLGGLSVLYDVIRSDDPASFSAGTCTQSGIASTLATDSATPPAGAASFFLVRAVNACSGISGVGSLGTRSDGAARPSRTCP